LIRQISKKHSRSSSSSSTSSSSSSSSNSSSNDNRSHKKTSEPNRETSKADDRNNSTEKRKEKKRRRKEKKLKKKLKKKSKSESDANGNTSKIDIKAAPAKSKGPMTKEEWEEKERSKKLRVAVDESSKKALLEENTQGLRALDTSWTWELGSDTRPGAVKYARAFAPHAQKF